MRTTGATKSRCSVRTSAGATATSGGSGPGWEPSQLATSRVNAPTGWPQPPAVHPHPVCATKAQTSPIRPMTYTRPPESYWRAPGPGTTRSNHQTRWPPPVPLPFTVLTITHALHAQRVTAMQYMLLHDAALRATETSSKDDGLMGCPGDYPRTTRRVCLLRHVLYVSAHSDA